MCDTNLNDMNVQVKSSRGAAHVGIDAPKSADKQRQVNLRLRPRTLIIRPG